MTPVASLDGLVDRDLVSGLHCLRDHHRQFIDDKGWVCLSRRNEILLDAEMDLQISTFEPTAIPRGKLWRLHLFIEAEDAMIEGSRLVRAHRAGRGTRAPTRLSNKPRNDVREK